MDEGLILVINTGSSSLKLGVYRREGTDEQLLLDALADGIGRENGTLRLRRASGETLRQEDLHSATQGDALRDTLRWVSEFEPAKPRAIGHRVVHGGPRLTEHQRITPEVEQELRSVVHFAPLHIPMALALIDAATQAYPDVPQFACFDTAFHSTMPEVATRFPIPGTYYEQGIRRYGFHGLSYESIVNGLGKELPKRLVVAHLGNGASLAAIEAGRSMDTSMGLTPLGGIPMATRSGDLDPGLLLYLMRAGHADADGLEQMLNHDAGLKAISGGESDMRELQTKAEAGDAGATMAIEIFGRAIAKFVASYAAVLGGLDLLVFTGGIGEHSAVVRDNVCRRLQFLGISLDGGKNASGEGELSTGPVGVRVMESEEDRQIARHCRRLSS